MTHLLMARLAANDGVITTRELNELDYDRHAISALVADGTLRRVRPRAYVHEPVASAAEPDVRHAMEVRSVLRTMPRYAATHCSALAVWCLPVVFTELTRINIARVGDGPPRNSRRVRVHPPVEAAAVTRHRGVDVVQPGVAIVQVAPESVAGALMAATPRSVPAGSARRA